MDAYADVIIKFSRMDRKPNFLSNGAPLARALRARGAPLKTALFSNQYTDFIELLHIIIFQHQSAKSTPPLFCAKRPTRFESLATFLTSKE